MAIQALASHCSPGRPAVLLLAGPRSAAPEPRPRLVIGRSGLLLGQPRHDRFRLPPAHPPAEPGAFAHRPRADRIAGLKPVRRREDTPSRVRVAPGSLSDCTPLFPATGKH